MDGGGQGYVSEPRKEDTKLGVGGGAGAKVERQLQKWLDVL